jgi:hypothetical protein
MALVQATRQSQTVIFQDIGSPILLVRLERLDESRLAKKKPNPT